jgi:hypothetical protein
MNGETVARIEAGRLEFSGLLSRAARLGDIEPVWSEPAEATEEPAAEAPAAPQGATQATTQAAPRGKARKAARPSLKPLQPVALDDDGAL